MVMLASRRQRCLAQLPRLAISQWTLPGAVLTMNWSYYLVGVAAVLLLVAYRLHGGLYRKDTPRDERLNRLIDERVDRLDLKRDKKHEPSEL
ncbi:hypothetical protein [Bradyrhizobium erythrophlei]|nr:hypothetical protein [Bradyrhizobium erythrophlei]